MTHKPAEDFIIFLAAAGIGLIAGTSIYAGMPRDAAPDIPVDAVFVHGFGGQPATRVMGGSNEVRWPLLMLQIRNKSMLIGDALAHSILNAVAGSDIATYLDVEPLQSEPNYAGQDENQHHMWNHSFKLVYEE